MDGVIDSAELRKTSAKLLTGFMGGIDKGGEGVTLVGPELWQEQDAQGETKADVLYLTGGGRLQQWKEADPQERQRMNIGKLTVEQDRYSLLLAMKCSEVESNQLRQYIALAKAQGADASDWEEEQTANLLVGGLTDTFEDGGGKKFFDSGRKVAAKDSESPTYTNLIASALSASTYATARETLGEMTDASGANLRLGRRGYNLIVASNLESAGMDIVKVQNATGGASNKWYNTATLHVWPWLPNDIAFLQAKSPNRKPVAKVNFSKLRTRMTDDNSPVAIQHDEYWWQVYCRMSFMLLDPQGIVAFDP
jgi:hypothetical protein